KDKTVPEEHKTVPENTKMLLQEDKTFPQEHKTLSYEDSTLTEQEKFRFYGQNMSFRIHRTVIHEEKFTAKADITPHNSR
ncbi:MAG: hypothetical protein LBD27_02180, partial [Tannerella sp.]|nr:hypothetical protein [Tannerella sp.]